MIISKDELKEKAVAFIDSLDDIIAFEWECGVEDITCLGDEWRQLRVSPIFEMRIKGLRSK